MSEPTPAPHWSDDYDPAIEAVREREFLAWLAERDLANPTRPPEGGRHGDLPPAAGFPGPIPKEMTMPTPKNYTKQNEDYARALNATLWWAGTVRKLQELQRDLRDQKATGDFDADELERLAAEICQAEAGLIELAPPAAEFRAA